MVLMFITLPSSLQHCSANALKNRQYQQSCHLANGCYEDVYSPHRQKTQTNRTSLKYYLILQ